MKKPDYDGFIRNVQEVQEEFLMWLVIMERSIKRFRRASLRGDKTNVFHLIQNLFTETWRAFPRTLSYLTTFGLIGFAGYGIYSLFV